MASRVPRRTLYPCDDLAVDRYDRGGGASQWASYDAYVNTSDDALDDLAIADCQDYLFSHTDNDQVSDDDSVQNLNIFKRISGAFGQVLASASGSAIAGGSLLLVRDDSGEVVQTSETDQDGSYLLLYKHKGKPALYNVFLLGETEDLVHQIELQGNGWVEVMFDVDTWTTTAEYGSGRNKSKR